MATSSLQGLGNKFQFTGTGKYTVRGPNAPRNNHLTKAAGNAQSFGNFNAALEFSGHIYDSFNAKDEEELKAAEKSLGMDVLSYGLGEINPVLGVGPFIYDYYTHDKEWIKSQYNSYLKQADTKDAKQWERNRLYDFEKENWPMLHGGQSYWNRSKETFIGPGK